MSASKRNKTPPLLFDSNGQSLAAGILSDLFDRAEEEAENALRDSKRNLPTKITKSRAETFLAELPALRAEIHKPYPSWQYLADVLLLQRALPPPSTTRRLYRDRQSDAAKSPRTNALNALLASIYQAHPNYKSRDAYHELRGRRAGKGIIVDINDEIIEWLDNGKRKQTKISGRGFAKLWSRIKKQTCRK